MIFNRSLKTDLADMYPKVAKCSVWILFLSFFSTCIFVFADSNLGIGIVDPNLKHVFSTLMAILLLPSLLAFKYFLDPVGREVEAVGFVEDPQLAQMIQPLLQEVSLDVRVGYYQSEAVNAFTISSISGKNSIIAFSSELINQSNQAQLLAFAAHEVAHLKNRDSVNKAYILSFNEALRSYPMLFAALSQHVFKLSKPIAIYLAVVMVAIVAFSSSISGLIRFAYPLVVQLADIYKWPLMAIGGYFFLDYGLNTLVCRHSRQREFVADADGAAMTSSQDMKSALVLLTDPGTKIGVFDTHPPLAERLARLST
jgi:Zn-dependent protease with chaperone function